MSPFVRYLKESGEVEIVPCSVADVVHLETLRLRVNKWLGRPNQLGNSAVQRKMLAEFYYRR